MTELPPIREDQRRSLRQSIAVAAGVALVFGVVAWLLVLDSAADPHQTNSIGAIASTSPSPQLDSASPAPMAIAPIEPPAPSPTSAGEMEVCGLGWVSLEGDPDAVAARGGKLVAESADKTKSLILPAMLASADERTQAAALRFMANSIGSTGPDAQNCVAGPECDDVMRRSRTALSHRDALATMASRTSDPQVYAWALQACGGSSTARSGACQMISAEQWARLDPDNGAAWQGVALQAQARHDAFALDDAMYHLAMSNRYEEGWGALQGHLLQSLPAGEEHLLGAAEILVEAIGIDAAYAIPPMQVMMGYCSAKLLGDSNRREICGRIADTLLDHSNTLLDWQMGRALLARVGGSAARLQEVADQADAFSATGNGRIEEPIALDCRAIERQLEQARDLGQLGELGMARRAVAKSGKPVVELAAAWRVQRDQAAAADAAQRAASSVEPTNAASAPRVAALR